MNAKGLRLAILATVLSIAGCASTQVSPDRVISPPDAAAGTQWTISAKSDSGTFSDTLHLYINGTEIASGTVSSMSTQTLLKGTYQNHSIEASCKVLQREVGLSGHTCQVFVDGKAETTLDF